MEISLFKSLSFFLSHEFQGGFGFLQLFFGDAVDEENAVQMVDFMLQAFCEEMRAFHLHDLSVQQCRFEDDACGTGDVSADAWQAEAAFTRTDGFRRE